MSKLLRHFNPGQIYFITSVTHDRQPILVSNPKSYSCAVDKAKVATPFEVLAWVLMPDHFHVIINPFESYLPDIIKRIKLSFAYQYRSLNGLYRAKVWQSRYWDHVIRNEDDLHKHIDYIHYNPVKHGLVSSPFDWEHSSIHDYLKDGIYSPDWGIKGNLNIEGNFGE